MGEIIQEEAILHYKDQQIEDLTKENEKLQSRIKRLESDLRASETAHNNNARIAQEREAVIVKLRAACEAALSLEELTWQGLDKLYDKQFKEQAKIQAEIDAINQQLRAALEGK